MNLNKLVEIYLTEREIPADCKTVSTFTIGLANALGLSPRLSKL
ncbi:MAG: hypothetical protein QW818_03950 [Candidatus Aenigmatarchaeota archaeon]